MRQEEKRMTGQIEPGATVECSDYPLGTVERVEGAGDGGALLVRPARADYLLRVPRHLIAAASGGRVQLKVTLEELERYALAHEPAEPTRADVTTRPTDPAPRDDEILGRQPGEPPTSPATG
jgi:hypothetical protein